MNKANYEAPKIEVISIAADESIASGTTIGSITVEPMNLGSDDE